jgi:hypothetical protein
VGSCEETEAAGVNFETLVDGKLAGKIDRTLRKFRVNFIMVAEGRGKK